MNCRFCKRTIPDNSLFCNWCGKEQKRNKSQISVPKPRQRADGLWTAQIMVYGKRTYVPPQPTEAKYYVAARALKTEMIETKKSPIKITLKQACLNYIDAKRNILSPSSIYGYERVLSSRFQSYMKKDIHSINYQMMLNKESALISPKTIRTNWAFISSVLKFHNVVVPDVGLPPLVRKDLPWLDAEQIKVFVNAIEGEPCELGALLGLHSLRRSEILSITPSKVYDGFIHVEGSTVRSSNGLVSKETNKNSTSRRAVPIMMPRLKYLLSNSDCAPDEPYVKSGQSLFNHINKICEENGLPLIGLHGLRRSFASLAHSLGWDEKTCMKYGGWSSNRVMHDIYIKLSEEQISDDVDLMKAFYGYEIT